MLMCYYTCSLL